MRERKIEGERRTKQWFLERDLAENGMEMRERDGREEENAGEREIARERERERKE